MGVFVSSTTSVRRHGAYAIEATQPTQIKAIGTGVASMVGQFPWGPSQTLVKPASAAELYNTFAPPGMTRTGSAYLSLIRKAFPTLRAIRAVSATAVAASATIPTALAVDVLTLTLKYPGTAGNSVIATIKAASDGNANHFNLEVSVTSTSGTTTDVLKNLNISGTGADALPTASDLAKCLLIGTVAKIVAGIPEAGAYTFSLGTSPAVISSDYVGTAGTSDKGLAVLETDKGTRHVFVDDPGDTLRAAVNAGVKAHVAFMGDRLGYVNGDSGNTQAEAATDVANYRSDRVIYVDPWVYVLDDVDGTKRLVPPAPFCASVASQLVPSTSFSWKNAEVQTMLGGIDSLESNRGEAAADNTDAGIATIIQEETGGFTFEAGVTAYAPVDPTLASDTRRRMADYMAVSMVRSTRGSIDGPNVPVNQQDIVNAVEIFLSNLVKAKDKDPNHTVHLLDGAVQELAPYNSQADLDAGNLTIPFQAKTSSGIHFLFFRMTAGEGVTVG